MGYKNWIDVVFLSTIFQLVYAFFAGVYYFTGLTADWDQHWRVIFICASTANFFLSPFFAAIIAYRVYWREESSHKQLGEHRERSN